MSLAAAWKWAAEAVCKERTIDVKTRLWVFYFRHAFRFLVLFIFYVFIIKTLM